MRRTPRVLVTLLTAALAVPSHATWRAVSVAGTPRSVEVWRPDVFSVATSSQATLHVGTTTAQTVAGGSSGTFVTAANCLLSLQRLDGRLLSSGCQTASSPFSLSPLAQRMRHTATGGGYAAAASASEVELVYSPTGALTGGAWTPLPSSGEQPTAALGATRHGGADHALFGTLTRLLWFRGATSSGSLALPGDAAANELQLLDTGAAAPLALVGNRLGLYRGTLDSAAFEPVAFPSGAAEVLGVSVGMEGASPLATGFGMAVLRRGGVTSLARAELLPTLGDAGARWREALALPPLFDGAPLQSVSCLGAGFCVVSLSRADTSNVFVYTNDAPPALSLPASLELSGGVPLELSVTATDADGDPLRLVAEAADLSVGATPLADGVGLRLETARACVDRASVLTVRASDGLATHDVSRDVPVTVRANRLPVTVTPEAGAQLVAQCGGPAEGTLTQAAAPDGCPVAVRWTQLEGPPLEAPALSGETVTLRTSSRDFEDVGQEVVLRVEAEGEPGNVASGEQRVLVTAGPFVELEHALEAAQSPEGRLVGVTVTMRNTSACAAAGLELVESLAGLSWVAGSARLDGASIEPVVEGGTLRVGGLALAPGQVSTLTFVARTELLGRPAVRGELRLGSVAVSATPSDALDDSGCGCRSAPSSGGLGALLFSLAAWRRKRARRVWTAPQGTG